MNRGLLAVARYELLSISKGGRFLAVILLYLAMALAAYAEILAQGFPPTYIPPQTWDAILFPSLAVSFAGIILGFDAVSGGIESRRLNLLFSYPIGRGTLITGIISARYLLVLLPALISSAALFSSFWQPGLDFATRFLSEEGILALGALFWLGVGSALSAVTRNSGRALLYSIVTIPFIAYGDWEVYASAVLSFVHGRLVVPGLFSADPLAVTIEEYIRLDPGQAIQQLGAQLFDCAPGCGGYAYTSLWNWFTGTGYTQIQWPPAVPGYIMLSALAGITILVLLMLALSLRRMEV